MTAYFQYCAVLALGAVLLAAPRVAHGHDGEQHGAPADAQAHLSQSEARVSSQPVAAGFPVDITLDFDLIDQHGRRRTEADFDQVPLAVFFGYANCQSICEVALPRLADAIDLAGEAGIEVQPVLITIDPARDTPEALARVLPDIHPQLIGLTGDGAQLAAARSLFQIEIKPVSTDADGAPVYSHGSFIYLFAPGGKLASIMPPVLGAERMAEIMTAHLSGKKPHM